MEALHTIEEGKHIGRELVAWQVDEYMRHERGVWWYVIAAVVGAALIIYAIATSNFMFAVILLMIGIITLITTFTEPDRVDVVITSNGIMVGDTYHEYKEIKDFSIIYEPPEVKYLYISFNSAFHPLLAIPLEDVDPIIVRQTLLTYALENLGRDEETLTDTVRRLYKF